MLSPIPNAILVRELRARWRGGRSMILVLAYASLLALATGLMYASSSINASANGSVSLNSQMAAVGHSLFLLLSALQIGGWLLLGPSLTATTIAGEREHGLLEGLQLTPLTAGRICFGKLLSASLLVLLLLVAPLPITAICFLLG